jgi:hypothetical protein
MDMAMEIATALTSVAVETASEDTLERMERNENRKRRRSCEAPATAWALGGQQQACELPQLYRTIAQMANMLRTPTALQVAQWRGMKLWLEEKETKRDAHHQDNLQWGKGITDMVARAVAPSDWAQKVERKADTEDVSLEASIHADLTQTG